MVLLWMDEMMGQLMKMMSEQQMELMKDLLNVTT
jgi:hypothetical protein